MSFTLQAKIWPLPATALPQAEKLVLLRMSFFAANDGTNVRPFIRDLAIDCSMSERTTQRAIQELLKVGVLVKVREADFARKQPCEYRIDVDALDQLSTPENPADGCHIDTGDNLTPVTDCHSTGDKMTPVPVTNCHPSNYQERLYQETKEEIPSNKPAEPGTDLLGNAVLPDRDECAEAVAAWNAMADRADLPAVARLTDKRRTALRLRLKELGGIEGWRIALEKVEASPFLKGQVKADFRASFDFLLNGEKLTRLMEGTYDARQPAPGNRPARRGWEIAPEAERRAGIIEGARRAARGNFGDKPSMRDAAADFLAGFEDEDFR